MDTIRRILQEVESDEGIRTYDTIDEAYQVALMDEAGLVVGRVVEDGRGRPHSAFVIRLSWAGHDFLDAARNDTLWKKAKDKVLKPGISWTFSLLSEYLKEEAKKHLFGSSLDPLPPTV